MANSDNETPPPPPSAAEARAAAGMLPKPLPAPKPPVVANVAAPAPIPEQRPPAPIPQQPATESSWFGPYDNTLADSLGKLGVAGVIALVGEKWGIHAEKPAHYAASWFSPTAWAESYYGVKYRLLGHEKPESEARSEPLPKSAADAKADAEAKAKAAGDTIKEEGGKVLVDEDGKPLPDEKQPLYKKGEAAGKAKGYLQGIAATKEEFAKGIGRVGWILAAASAYWDGSKVVQGVTTGDEKLAAEGVWGLGSLTAGGAACYAATPWVMKLAPAAAASGVIAPVAVGVALGIGVTVAGNTLYNNGDYLKRVTGGIIAPKDWADRLYQVTQYGAHGIISWLSGGSYSSASVTSGSMVATVGAARGTSPIALATTDAQLPNSITLASFVDPAVALAPAGPKTLSRLSSV